MDWRLSDMATWIERYRAGDCAAVWAEMEVLGSAIRNPVNRKLAAPVVEETMERCRRNAMWLFETLPQIGYRFSSALSPAKPDYALELRIAGALKYVELNGGKKYRKEPFTHPVFAWLEEEEIELPERHRNGRPGRANYRAPGPRIKAKLDELEPLPMAVRAWFEAIGWIDLTGTHPLLNRGGNIETLRAVTGECEHGDSAGAAFVARIREAFAWGGFPGWRERGDAPQRELDWLRSKIEAM
jgi:hypothetical protein